MIKQLLRLFGYLLQLMIVTAIVGAVFREMSGGESLADIVDMPLGAPAHALLVVCLFLLISLYIGFSSVWQAWRMTRQESVQFENRRKNDLNPAHWAQLKENATAPQVEDALKNDAALYGAEAHHSVRFALILKSACRKDAKLPTLSDLRSLTYAAEAARKPVWKLRIVLSVLLIIGILGTLVGVHAAIGSGQFCIEKLQPALLPASLAVFFTILLIVCCGAYRKRVDEYIGRLDRHTVSFYYPFFRPAEKSSVQLQEITDAIASFSESVKGMSGSIAGMDTVPQRLAECGEQVHAVRETLGEWQQKLFLYEEAPAYYDRLLDRLNDGDAEAQQLREQLLSDMELLTQRMDSAHSLLFDGSAERWVQASVPFSDEVSAVQQYAAHTPELPTAARMSVENHWATAENMKDRMRGVVAMGQEIGSSLAASVQQAESSAASAQKTAQMYAEVMNDARRNAENYTAYRQLLDGMFEHAHELIQAKIASFDQRLQHLRDIRDLLQERNENYSKEKMIYWYELAIGLGLLVLFFRNMALTLNMI